MKRYEKTILILFVVAFLLQLLAFPGKNIILVLGTWLLAGSYFMGGYWLFEGKKNRRIALSIISGIALGSSLYSLPFLIWMKKESYFNYLPIINGLFFLFLSLYIWKKRKSDSNRINLKPIWTRSIIVFIFISFFTYSPISFKPYRSAIYALNNGNNRLQINIKMFDYTYEYDEAMKKGDCDEAIQFAVKANQAGTEWLGNVYDPQLWQISGTYSNLYLAYKCKADEYYENKNYHQALTYYLKSDQALTNYQHKSEEWKTEHLFNKNTIAICYKNLQNYETADSLFVEVIEQYNSLKGKTDRNSALFYSDLAESLLEQGQFDYSNQLFKVAIAILKKETTTEEIKADLVANYHGLIKNNLQTDSLEQVKFYLDETYKIIDRSTLYFGDTKLYDGLYFYKKNQYGMSDKMLLESLACYQRMLEPTSQTIAENYLVLAQVKTALAEYGNARKLLHKGIAITLKNHRENSVRFANFLKVDAQLDKVLGNYREAEKKYNQILKTYEKDLGDKNSKSPEILANLAELEIILANYAQAKSHSDKSISIASSLVNLNNPSITSLINNAAYVNYVLENYKLADSLYQRTLQINKNFGLNSAASTAFALNGLGVLMIAKKEYNKATSYLTQSLELHKNIFSEDHPFTAIVYLNSALLKTNQKEYADARKMLTKALDINKRLFDAKHDVLADIYSVFGDIARKEKQVNLSKSYYQKAYDIYLEKFGPNHPKVKTLKEKFLL